MPEDVHVRAPRPQEFPACRMLLGADAVRPPGARFLLATAPRAPFILGAAAYCMNSKWTHGVRVHVLHTHRRQRIGSRLLEAIVDAASAVQQDGLMGVAGSSDDPAAPLFLQSHGLAATSGLRTVRIEFSTAVDVVLPLADRLRRSSHPLSSWRILPMAEAPRNAVVGLYAAELRRHPYTAMWSLADEVSLPCYAASPVLLSGDRVVGFLLYRYDERTKVGTIPARVVAPEFQGGPANLLLLSHALQIGIPMGVRAVEFDIPDGNADTDKLARRLSATLVRTKTTFAKALRASAH